MAGVQFSETIRSGLEGGRGRGRPEEKNEGQLIEKTLGRGGACRCVERDVLDRRGCVDEERGRSDRRRGEEGRVKRRWR